VTMACYTAYLVYFGLCYMRAWLTDPGKPSPNWKDPPFYEAPEDKPDDREALPLLSSDQDPYAVVVHSTEENKGDGYFWPYCEPCQSYKPLRTHHCRRCNRCTLKMDHHCMWVNNCVGFWNHKFFLQTLILAWTGCIIVLVFSILRTVFHPFEFDTDDDDFVRDLIYFIIFCAGNLCVVAQLFSLSGMVFFHLYLISHNMTHIEYNCCKGMASGCRFNRGLLFNLFELLGKYWILSLVPYYIPPEGLHGDNYKPISGGSEVDQALIEEWRKKRAKKRCGGMGDLCTGPCQAFS